MDEREWFAALSAKLVKRVQSFGRIEDDPERTARRVFAIVLQPVPHEIREGGALDVVHDENGDFVLELDSAETHDVRMAQAQRDFGLAPKRRSHFGIVDQVCMRQLSRNEFAVGSREPYGRVSPDSQA